ncbi:DUF975 family protein [Inconstantimicrobium mannanitabidum]|uniref:Uncharacterized protein n=1 Tax=Inconstantimicrobium mannanitabidum TaxID=1604901 RepID=A0ACB5RBL3_9CLOT|nr:DUF975 family protein [Clostridium sp. TW13]GKX66520.1 hypothetical protein rsdtw13_17780 [Clostridium sp. TW13]
MWSRKELKDRAKSILREIYWCAFGVSIVIALAGGGSSGGGSAYHHNDSNVYNHFDDWRLALILLTISIGIVVLIFLRIFIGYNLEVGGRRYFIQSAQRKNNKKCFSFAFKEGNYIGIVKTMFVTKVFIFLWTLLLIIPGIIKSYAYRMVPYILADNPNIGVMDAIKLSNEMTRGHKFEIFVLDLSFIGWYLLGALALGVGVLFVMPYENATNAELYLVLRNNALTDNLCSSEDLLLQQQNTDEFNEW